MADDVPSNTLPLVPFPFDDDAADCVDIPVSFGAGPDAPVVGFLRLDRARYQSAVFNGISRSKVLRSTAIRPLFFSGFGQRISRALAHESLWPRGRRRMASKPQLVKDFRALVAVLQPVVRELHRSGANHAANVWQRHRTEPVYSRVQAADLLDHAPCSARQLAAAVLESETTYTQETILRYCPARKRTNTH